MNISEIIIREKTIVEFKESLSLTKEGLLALTAMINSESGSGTVLFGVKDNGDVKGIELGNRDKIQKTLVEKIEKLISPRLLVTIEIENYKAVDILILNGKRQPNIAYHEFDGRAYIRVGTTCRQLSLEEKEGLKTSRDKKSHNGPWICRKCNSVDMSRIPHPSASNYVCSCGGTIEAFKC